MNMCLRALAQLLVMSSVALAVLPVGAQVSQLELPSSPHDPIGGEWEKMRPSSFEATNESALQQCLRVAFGERLPWLDAVDCQHFFDLLEQPDDFPEEDRCRPVFVKDGIVIDAMNGIINGNEGVTYNIKKALGRYDPALLCPL